MPGASSKAGNYVGDLNQAADVGESLWVNIRQGATGQAEQAADYAPWGLWCGIM